MKIADTSTPAVVLVCHRHGGVGIVRSLGRLGVPVYAVDPYRGAPAFFSRYCKGHFVWDLIESRPDDSVNFLIGVAEQIGRKPVLIATNDIGAMFIARNAKRLTSKFVFPRQDSSLVDSLCSKREMYFLARKFGVPAPETIFPQSRQEVLDSIDKLKFPVLLKPIYTRVPDGRASYWRMIKVFSPRELLENYDRVENPSAPNAMLQEYIPGAEEITWTFNGYFDQRGECACSFVGRKLRNHPPYFGQASLALATPNEIVAKTTVDFMKAIGYRGALDVGYRYDVRDGRYKINDVNPRVGAMFRVFEDENGLDVVRALYQDLTGQQVSSATQRYGRKWLVEDVDLVSSARYIWDGNLTVREWLSSFRGVEETAFFAREDPMPLAGALMMDLWLPLKKRLAAIRSRYLARRSPEPTPVSISRLSSEPMLTSGAHPQNPE